MPNRPCGHALRLSLIAAVLCAALTGCATDPGMAQSDSSAPSVAVAASTQVESDAAAEDVAAVPELDPVVCKREIQIGTRVARRVCMKQSQWDQIGDSGKSITSDIQRRTTQTGNTTGQD